MNCEELNSHLHNENGFISLLGIKITELSSGYCKGELTVKPELLNPLRIIHGGCTFSLADTIGGSAALSHGKKVVTLDSTIHYLAPATNTKKLIAKAKEIKYGSTIAVYEVNVYTDSEQLVATSMQSYFILNE